MSESKKLKNIKAMKLSFCQNDLHIGESFWQKDSLITFLLSELCLITLLWIVLVFLTQTLSILNYIIDAFSVAVVSGYN